MICVLHRTLAGPGGQRGLAATVPAGLVTNTEALAQTYGWRGRCLQRHPPTSTGLGRGRAPKPITSTEPARKPVGRAGGPCWAGRYVACN